MQHRLAPDFILENLIANVSHGRFQGAAMFLDVSGFSKIMDTLMRQGQHGSEIMAHLMRNLFEPLVASVYGHDGYIVGFAGDAFTAVFPNDDHDASQNCFNALTAAWEIQTHLAQNDQYNTEYGSFQIGAKVGLAYGNIEWGILQASNEQRATFFYKGDAIQACSDAEHYANRCEILCNGSFVEQLAHSQFHLESREPYFLITAVDSPMAPQNESRLPNQAPELMSLFFPKQLVTQAISGEFRQIINLFINLQGSPPPDLLATFMETVFELQDQYGGLLNRIDFGDKGCHLLFFWGAPISYENDISRVLSFVQALQQQSDLTMRMGITYRIAHAGFIGSPLHEEYTCYGRGVNLAARFMTSAEWGQIWVDGNIAERANQLFITQYLGNQPFKGFTDPQDVHQFTGRRQIAQTPFYDGKLIGREEELATLNKFVEPIFNGRFAGTVVINGEAGIGKSRLIHDYFGQNNIFEKSNVFLCQTDEIIRQSLNPFRYWLRDHFLQSPTQGEERNREQFDLVLNRLVEQMPDFSNKEELARTRSFIGALLGLHWEDSLYEQLEPQLRFENTLNALKTLIKTEASKKPVIIQLEDAQWIDDDSLKFILRLTRNVENVPLALLITTRRPFSEDSVESGTPITQIHLGNLGKKATTQLVIEKIETTPKPRFLEWIMNRTEGNPFFVEQMILYLKENNVAMDSEDQLTLLQTESLLPTDVRSVLTARLDRLPSDVKEAIQNASVLGREFDKPVLQEMLNELVPVNQTLKRGADESIWVLLSQIRYLFRHMLFRDAAYEMQVHSRLKSLHEKAATAFESVYQSDLAPYYSEIAYHYDQAAITVKAVDYYERAADQARESYQNEEALEQYNHALSLTKPSDFERKYRFLLGKEAVLNWMGLRKEQEVVLSELDKLAKNSSNHSNLSKVNLLQASYSLVINQYENAIEFARKAAETAVSAKNKLAEARAYHGWGRAYWSQGQFQNALPYIKKALSLSRQEQSQIDEANNLYDLSVVHFYDNKYQLAIKFLNLAQTLYELTNDQSGVIRCQLLIGIIQSNSGNFIEALKTNHQVLTLSKTLGWRNAEARSLVVYGNINLELGDYSSSLSYHQNAISTFMEIGDWEGIGTSLDSTGLIFYYQNDFSNANKAFEEAIGIFERIQQPNGMAYVFTHFGYCLVDQDRLSEASDILQKALNIRNDLDTPALRIDTLAALAYSSVLNKDFQLAEKQINEILDWIDQNGIEGIEFPSLVHLTCYKTLTLLGSSYQSKATEILKTGYLYLKGKIGSMEDSTLKAQFKQNIPYHRELIQHWEATLEQ